MPDQLGKTLIDAAIPASSGRREELLRKAASRTSDATSVREGRKPRLTNLRIATAVAAALMVAGLLSLTPPGRALADEIAGLVGIGDEPTLDQSSDQDLAAIGQAVVVQAGVIPGTDQPYEISAYAADGQDERTLPDDFEAPDGPFGCLNLDLPGLDTQKQVDFNSTCLNESQRKVLDFNTATDNLGRLGSSARFAVGGLVSAEVADIVVTYEANDGTRAEAPVALALLTPEIARETGSPATFGQFFGFIPDDGTALAPAEADVDPIFSTVEVTAYDKDGVVLGTDNGKKFSPEVPFRGGDEPNVLVEVLGEVRGQVAGGKFATEMPRREAVAILDALISIEAGAVTGAELRLVTQGNAGGKLINQLRHVGALPDGLSIPSSPLPIVKLKCDPDAKPKAGTKADCDR